MPTVQRQTATADQPEGFIVTTQSGGAEYRYTLERLDEDTVECTKKEVSEGKGWEEGTPDATDAVKAEMNNRGFEVK